VNAKVLVGVALVAAVLFLGNLGRAPFLDPPEGVHAQIAWEMLRSGDWITPHLDAVPYIDNPPLLYWLIGVSFAGLGRSEWAARLWSALPAVAVAVLTARIGILLGSARVGLLAGLLVVANLEVFVFARVVKPDLLFVCLIWLALYACINGYLSGDATMRLVFYGSLGLAVLAKDIMGALGPLAVLALFFWLTEERGVWQGWVAWSGILLLLAIVAPWYALVEWRNPGFLWYSIVDNHLLNFARRRIFPDEEVPLGALEFVGVTAAGFFPWVLALPWAAWRVVSRRASTDQDRMWLLLGLWMVVVLGFFTFSPWRLPHYGLPAFPAMALLVARLWNDVIERAGAVPSPRRLLVPPIVLLSALAVLSLLVWKGALSVPAAVLSAADASSRHMTAPDREFSPAFLSEMEPLFATLGLVFGAGAVAIAAAVLYRQAMIGLGILLATMIAFLSLSGEGLAAFARSRSARVMTEAVALRAAPGDVFVHEGAIENSASWLLGLDRPVKIVDGKRSNLAPESTFVSAREVFWDRQALGEAWRGHRRVFLLSVVRPASSVIQQLPADRVHLMVEGGGRWLYSNRR
jgi:hypothetical protein